MKELIIGVIWVAIVVALFFIFNRNDNKSRYNDLKLTERAMLMKFNDGSWSETDKTVLQLYAINQAQLEAHKGEDYYSENIYPNH